MKKIRLSISVFVFAVLLGFTPHAKADDIELPLDITVGSTVNVTLPFGLDPDPVSNPNNLPLFLNFESFTVNGPLVLEDLFVPQTIQVGQTLDVPLFNLTAPLGTTPGIYTVFYSITGGFGDMDGFDIGANFKFDVNAQPAASPVPEPGTWLLLMTGMGGVGTMINRRRQVSSDRAA